MPDPTPNSPPTRSGRIGVIERYRDHLPVTGATPVISLAEGSTPLIHAPALSAEIGNRCQIHIKYEGLNPTGSFKDRGMTMALSKAVEQGARAVICASTGNTSAAAAAYAARAGIECVVLLPAGKIALGKLAQALVHGARVVAIDGNFDDALRLVRELGQRPDCAIVNSINPDRIQGQKSAAFEVIEELGDAPHAHFLPVGNAGNITAYWMGYREFHRLGRSTRLPRMTGFQAEGSAPIYHDHPIERPDTVATAIRIGNPASWQPATEAVRDSGGVIDIVTDDEILAAQRWLAAHEGIFVEPASAAPIAGLLKCHRAAGDHTSCQGCPLPGLPAGATLVCTVTGHGLKDADVILKGGFDPLEAPAEAGAVAKTLGW